MRDVGLMGEGLFSQLCAEVGLIANKSNVDKTGWDYLVEFPTSKITSVDDIHKGALECKVQVKATDKRNRKVAVTLSNLRRLTTYNGPSFLVVMEFDGQSHVNDIFVVHVDKNLMTKVIKKLHELDQSVKENNFNKRTMTIRYSEENLLTDSTGRSLAQRLKEHIGDDIFAYSAQKTSYLETTGYEEGRGLFKFKLEGADKLSALVSASLGVPKQVKVTNVLGKEIRFGIESRDPFIESNKAMVNIIDVKPTAIGTLTIKQDELSLGLEFDIDIYISQLAANLPDDLQQFRIDAGSFELLISPYKGNSQYSFKLGYDKRFEIRKIRDTLNFLKLLSNSKTPLLGSIKCEKFPELKFHLGNCGEQFEGEEEVTLLDSAVWLIEQFKISASVYASLCELNDSSVDIMQLVKVMKAPSDFTEVHCKIGRVVPKDSDIAIVSAVLHHVFGYVLGAVLTIVGRQREPTEDEFDMKIANICIDKKIAVKSNNALDPEAIKNLVHEVAKKYKDKYFVITEYDNLSE